MFNYIFSDEDRSRKIRLTLILLAMFCCYGIYKGPMTEITFKKIKTDMRTYTGKAIAFNASIIERGSNGIKLYDRGMTIYAEGLPSILTPEATINATGTVKFLNSKPTVSIQNYATANSPLHQLFLHLIIGTLSTVCLLYFFNKEKIDKWLIQVKKSYGFT
ncbi:hypothetical protein HGA91_04760 [candidate division WWE3 bacterium]|nr:hypothetical protein [candidate division WWE3 bacterium]